MATRAIKSLDGLMDGALAEQFTREFGKVLENVMDPNTKATATRSITMKVTIKPMADRAGAEILTDVVPKLAPMEGARSTVFLEVDDAGNITAREKTDRIPGQLDMDGNESIPKVVDFRKDQQNG